MDRARNQDRVKSAIGVAAFHAVLGYALLTGLGVDLADAASDRLRVFDVRQEPPPPPVEPPAPADSAAPEAPASPPNLKAVPSPIVAPPPEVRLEVPPPVVAAPLPGAGSDASAGASDRPGAGSGSGGVGTGAGGGPAMKARRIRGRLGNSDYPRAALRAGAEGVVLTRIAIDADGRVSDCAVTQSSGHAELDAVTCRLIERRFRYEPARDADGSAVPDVVFGTHFWRPRRDARFAGSR